MQLQASLRERCPDLPKPAAGDGATMLRWGIAVIRLYNECADRHDATVRAIEEPAQ